MSNNPQYPGLQPLRPPISGSLDPPRNFVPPMPVQFRPAVPTQQSQQFISMPSQHYQHQPVGPGGVPLIGVGMPPQNQQPQFSQPIQQLPPRPSPQLPPPSQAIPMPVARPNMHIPSESMMHQSDSQAHSQAPNGYTPGLGGPGMPLSSSYTFAPSTYGQVQANFNSTGQFQPVPQTHALMGSSSQSITTGATLQSNGGQPLVTTVTPSATIAQPQLAKNGPTDWIEHTSATGRTFYYNKKTKVSSWEKPFELMTPIEDFETADERQQDMAERSKELLQFEHKGTPLSSLESTLLVCDNKKESDTQTRRLPPHGAPLTAPHPPSQLLGKVKDFLGVMSEANKRLELDAKDNPENYDIEELTGNESEVIEMDLMLGVADLHTPEAVAAAESAISTCQPVIPLAADVSETDSEESSTDDDSGDDDIESSDDYHDDGNKSEKPSSLVQKSISSKDNKQKGNVHSKKRPRIVELS